MPDNNLQKQLFKTYIKMIENSEGSRIFNSLFVKEKNTGKEYDIYRDGVLSGAFFVSGLLSMLGLIDKPHSTTATIRETFEKRDKKDWGWQLVSTDAPKAGDVIFWEGMIFDDGTESDQVGFYVDEKTAYSTGSAAHRVIKHHPTFGIKKDGGPTRKIVAIYRHNFET